MPDENRPAARQMGELRDLVRSVRRRSGKSQVQVAEHLETYQSSVSRWETNNWDKLTSPESEQIQQLVELCGGTDGELARMLLLRSQIDSARRPSMMSVLNNPLPIQQRVRELEEASSEINSYRPDVIPGGVQVPAYIRAIFNNGKRSEQEVEALVEERLSRRALMDDTNRSFTLIATVGALLWTIGGRDVMVEQLRYLADFQRPNVRLGVIDHTVLMPTTAQHPVDIFRGASTEAMMGLLTGTTTVPDDGSANFEALEGHWRLVERRAKFGVEASAVFAWAADLHERGP